MIIKWKQVVQELLPSCPIIVQLPGALLFAWSENYTNLSAFKWDTIQTHFFMCLISYKKGTVLTLHALFILSPYKVLGKREQSKFLCPCHFLALNLHIYYKDLETWYSKKVQYPIKTILELLLFFTPRLTEPHNHTSDEGNLHFPQVSCLWQRTN